MLFYLRRCILHGCCSGTYMKLRFEMIIKLNPYCKYVPLGPYTTFSRFVYNTPLFTAHSKMAQNSSPLSKIHQLLFPPKIRNSQILTTSIESKSPVLKKRREILLQGVKPLLILTDWKNLTGSVRRGCNNSLRYFSELPIGGLAPFVDKKTTGSDITNQKDSLL